MSWKMRIGRRHPIRSTRGLPLCDGFGLVMTKPTCVPNRPHRPHLPPSFALSMASPLDGYTSPSSENTETTLLLPYVRTGIPRESWKRQITDEARILISYATPLILTFLLQMSYTITPTILLGRLGTSQLAAVTLASTYMTLTGNSFHMGAATALDTLCSQAYTGRKAHLYEVGIHLQRGLLFSAVLYIPIWILWWNAAWILAHMGQSETAIGMAEQVIKILMVGLPGSIAFDCIKRYLQAQGIMKASTYVLLVMAPIGILLMTFLISTTPPFGIGMLGAPVSQSIIYWSKVILIVLYAKYVRGAECWGGWSWEAFSNWGPFLRLALPGIVVVCSSLWALELLNLAAGTFGPMALAAQAIALQCSFVGLVLHIGIASAATNRVGHLMGSGEAKQARLSAFTAVGLSTSIGFVNGFALFWYRKTIPAWFNRDADVVELVSMILALLSFLVVFAGVAQVCAGILIGMGRQKTAAWIKMTCVYVIGLPCSLFFAFHLEWNLKGLWVGYFIATVLVVVLEVAVLLRLDWHQEVRRCHNRLGEVSLRVTIDGVEDGSVSSND